MKIYLAWFNWEGIYTDIPPVATALVWGVGVYFPNEGGV